MLTSPTEPDEDPLFVSATLASSLSSMVLLCGSGPLSHKDVVDRNTPLSGAMVMCQTDTRISCLLI